eukprot:g11977.t1
MQRYLCVDDEGVWRLMRTYGDETERRVKAILATVAAGQMARPQAYPLQLVQAEAVEMLRYGCAYRTPTADHNTKLTELAACSSPSESSRGSKWKR